MALQDIISLGGILGTLINAVIVWIILIIANKLVSHNLGAKRAFILAFIALFITPIVASFVLLSVALPDIIAVYVIPLIVWIILGEILLKGGNFKQKLTVIVIAFVVYIILSFVGIQGMLASLIPSVG